MESGGGTPYIIFGLGLLCLSLFLLYVMRRRSERNLRQGSFDAGGGEAQDRLERLLGDIQSLSRDQIAKLDSKIRMLDQLLSECDRRKEEIEALLAMSPPSPSPAPEPAAPRPGNALHDQVYALQDKGRAMDDICGETGLEKGEVELILGLRRMDASEVR